MPKRKRGNDENPSGSGHASGGGASGLKATLARSVVDLARALRQAKGFERQRQAKRLHDGSCMPEKRARLEREAAMLKTLDLTQTARAHLVSVLLRYKPAASAPGLPASVRTAVPLPAAALDPAARAVLHNVTSNLYKQPAVREVADRALRRLCRELGVDPPGGGGGRRKRDRPVPREEEEEEEKEGVGNEKRGHEEDNYQDDQEDEEDTVDEDEEEVEVEEEGEEGEKGEEGGGRIDSENEGAKELALADLSEAETGDDNTDSDDDHNDTSPGPKSRRPKKQQQQAKANNKPSTSTFLPTLMSGYIPGSESGSDLDIAPPKRRLGQRQRQAIWEKKYGDRANHQVQRQQRLDQDRDAGWDARRGAVGQGGGGQDQGPRWQQQSWKRDAGQPRGGQAGGGSGGSGGGRDGGWRTGGGPAGAALHPSWQAKARRKSIQVRAMRGGGASNKILFD